MKSILEPEERENFYIKLYFGNSSDLEMAGIRKAYLDFNRTLKIPEDSNQKDRQEKRDNKRSKTELFLKKELQALIKSECLTQKDFDLLHKKLCKRLITEWNELSFGQAQKWINMSLKYWLLLGDSRVMGIEKNALFFHMPIDGIIQERFFGKNLPPWSQINSYEDYFKYQIDFRKNNIGKVAIVEEFKEFNK